MDDDFERILNETFNNSYNNNIPISTSEANNVNDIFVGNEVKTECIICYEDNIPCIKCFQCTAVYCKVCLTKIASDSNKCICAIEIKSNYSKLKKYNQNLIKQARDNKNKKDKINKKILNKNDNKNNNKNYNNNDNKNDNKNKNNNNKNNNNNNNLNTINYNYNDTLINDNYSDSNSNNLSNINYNNDSDSSLTLKLNFLKDLTDNKIYNIDFKSFCNKVGPNVPNFDYYWDYQNKTLTFYAVPNHSQELKNIIFDYNILNAENQGEIYVWILEILELPFNNFKKKWNTIADIMPQITDNNKITMISKIVDICK